MFGLSYLSKLVSEFDQPKKTQTYVALHVGLTEDPGRVESSYYGVAHCRRNKEEAFE